MKQIFLDSLPTKMGIGKQKDKSVIDWKNSNGCIIPFIYDDIKGNIEIVDYDSKTQYLTVKYFDNDLFKIQTGNLVQCKLGKLLRQYGEDFKIELGKVFTNRKRNLVIIDREYRINAKNEKIKWYKYKCNVCNAELWMREGDVLGGNGCGCCRGLVVIKDINSIYKTNPNLIKYFVDINDAYTNTAGSHNQVLCKCPECGYSKNISIYNLNRQGFSCLKCSDSISYPEKVMYFVLKQLDINFITQLNRTNLKWCNKYKYDFAFEYNDEMYIVETHGKQHYEEGSKFKVALVEQQEIDRNKKSLAVANGVKECNYITIDCRYSDFDFIKQNILDSRLNCIFDLNNVNWIEVQKCSSRNLVKTVCDYWNNKQEHETTSDLAKHFKLGFTTIISYLKTGQVLNWCRYDAREEMQNQEKDQ